MPGHSQINQTSGFIFKQLPYFWMISYSQDPGYALKSIKNKYGVCYFKHVCTLL